MSIEFRCSNCGQRLGVPEEAAGRNAKCPACGTVLPVPVASAPTEGKPAVDKGQPGLPPKQPVNPFADDPSAGPAHEDYNPYASPHAPTPLPSGKSAGGPLKHTKFSFEVIGYAWNAMQSQLGTCVLFGLIMIGIMIGSAIVSAPLGMIQQMGGVEGLLISQLTQQAWNLLVDSFTTCITAQFGLLVLRGHREPLAGMFQASSSYFKILLMFLVIAAVVVLACLLCGSPLILSATGVFTTEMAVIGVVVLAVPVVVILIVVFYMILLSQFFIIDRQAQVMESFRLSAQYMAGNKLVAFGVMLVTVVVGGLAVALTCGIGALFFLPFMAILQAIMYLSATGQFVAPADRLAAKAPPGGIYPPMK